MLEKSLATIGLCCITAAAAADPIHRLLPGPSVGNDYSFDVWVETPDPGDDWNASQISVHAFGGVTIVDSIAAAWMPPMTGYPEYSDAIRTFVVGPGSLPYRFPLVLGSGPIYTGTEFRWAWLDTPGTVAPSPALIARIGLTMPSGVTPEVVVGIVPSAWATIEGQTVTQLFNFPVDYAFSVIPEPGTLALIASAGLAALLRKR